LQRPLQGNVRILRYGRRRRPQSLVESFQAAHDRANRMNEERYREILAGYDDLRGRVMGDLAGVGAQEKADIERDYRSMGSDVQQSLINRGFGNSSLGATMQFGVNRERLGALGRLNDRLARQRSQFDVGITTGKLGAIERRSDVGPDPAMLLQLAQAAGASGMGPGGSFAQPLGVPNYGQIYNQALMQHLMTMGAGMSAGVNRFPVPLANLRAQQNRFRRYGGGRGRPSLNQVDISNLGRFQGIV
jgi:hypothetical protein